VQALQQEIHEARKEHAAEVVELQQQLEQQRQQTQAALAQCDAVRETAEAEVRCALLSTQRHMCQAARASNRAALASLVDTGAVLPQAYAPLRVLAQSCLPWQRHYLLTC
jgi:hypothetical protein